MFANGTICFSHELAPEMANPDLSDSIHFTELEPQGLSKGPSSQL